MTKAKNLLENLTQYSVNGNSKVGSTVTSPILSPGIFKIQTDMQGRAHFIEHNLVTDEIIRFEDPRHTLVLQEVRSFWGLADKFKGLKFTHKRGILLEGLPGSGKSILLKLMMEDIVSEGDVVFLSSDLNSTVAGLTQFRQIEPNRKVVVIFEDVDEIVRYNERKLLELMDGDSQIDGVLYIGTTNYLERLSPRAKRSGRFDRIINIPFPPKAGRKAYFEKKIGMSESEEVVEGLSDVTKGFSFGMLKELLVSTYIYGYNVSETVKRLNKTNVHENKSRNILESSVRNLKMTAEQKTDLESLLTELQKNILGS